MGTVSPELMARRGIIGALVGAVTLMLGGCNPFTNSASYRYRMTVEGTVEGSAVYEVLAEHTRTVILADEKPGGSMLRGEALVLRTASGPLFLLLKNKESTEGLFSAVTHALTPDIPAGGHDNFWKAVNRLGGWTANAKADLPREDWPLIVRFRDLNDPKSVEKVNPGAVGLKRIVVETTSDHVTTGIEERLGWLSSQQGSFVRRLSVPDPTNPPIAAILNKYDFSTEIGN